MRTLCLAVSHEGGHHPNLLFWHNPYDLRHTYRNLPVSGVTRPYCCADDNTMKETSMSNDNGAERPKKDVALFLDFENVYISVRQVYNQNPNFEALAEKADEFGRVIISRAYADWYRYQRITNALYANGIEPVYVPTYYYGQNPQHSNAIKNSVDIHMTIDAMRTLYTHDNIQTYIFITGDRDFIPLMNAIRQYGKECIVVGVAEAASSHLAQSADQFFFYHQIVEGLLPEARVRDPFEGLIESVNLARERRTDPTFATVKLLMQEIMGSFDERRVKGKDGKGFPKFKDFVREAEKRGLVKVHGSGTLNLVLLPNESAPEPSNPPSMMDALPDSMENEIALPMEPEKPPRAARSPRPTRTTRTPNPTTPSNTIASATAASTAKKSTTPAPVTTTSSASSKKSTPATGSAKPARQSSTASRRRTKADDAQPTPPDIKTEPVVAAVKPVAVKPITIEESLSLDPNDPATPIIQAVQLARRRNNLCTLTTIKALVRELHPDFDETQFKNAEGENYKNIRDLVQDGVNAGKLQLLTTGTVKEIFLPGEDMQKLSRFANRGRK
jgi:uncharacterized protein (TIGR00288 family)